MVKLLISRIEFYCKFSLGPLTSLMAGSMLSDYNPPPKVILALGPLTSLTAGSMLSDYNPPPKVILAREVSN